MEQTETDIREDNQETEEDPGGDKAGRQVLITL